MSEERWNQYVDRYKSELAGYGRAAVVNCWFYRAVATLQALLTAATPVSALLNKQWWTVGLSSSLALLVAIDRLFRFHEVWLINANTYQALDAEWQYWLAGIGRYKNCATPRSLFVRRIEEIMANEHEAWLTVRKNPHDDAGTDQGGKESGHESGRRGGE